ncbi:MAG: FlgD immunoglobulin-like domain containing protein [Candidatus Eiseniibacteriota bacterium]
MSEQGGIESRSAIGAGAPAPTIDGNIADLISYGVSLSQGCLDTESLTPDLRPRPGDVCKTNALLIPCTAPQVACTAGGGTYFLNGFDLLRAVVAYDRSTQTLYLGQRVAGIIADSDGDGTVGPGVGCTPPLNMGQQRIQDAPGIGLQESYSWGLDTDCNGKSDILIRTQTGTGGVVGIEVLGITAGATQGAFNGSDIEARVEGIDLPFIFAMTAFSGSTTDGLSEDATNAVQCGEPNVDLEITKSANPVTLCPDGTTTFTIQVRNTGGAPLTTVLTDQLPADLTFDNNVTGDFTVDTVVGGLITFDPLVIPAGATRTVSFRVLAGPTCFGVVRNNASATGTFTEACIETGGKGPLSVTRTAFFDVTCKDRPCVELTVNPLPPQCEGTPVTITGSVLNCSREAETIVVSVLGGGSQNLGSVPAGQTANFSIPAGNLVCKTGSETFTVEATATGDCAPPATDKTTVTVECSDTPCVELTVNPLQPQCEGTPVTITGSVRNCSDDPETIVVQLLGGGSQNLGVVAAGGSANFSIPAGNLDCIEGNTRTYSLTATATGACAPAGTDTETVTITCQVAPCVELTVNPLAPQCAGTPVTITGSVRNCSTAPETIVVQLLGGGSADVGTVQPGQSANWSIPAGDLVCDGGSRTYSLTATATGECPPVATDTETVTIECQVRPCVLLTLDPLGPRCEGAPVTITGSVRNCSSVPETIVVQVEGDGSQNLGSVGPGQTANFSIDAGPLDCGPGNTRTYNVTATATASCPPSVSDTKSVTVECQSPPCVEIQLDPIPPQCTGTPVTITGRVLNCSDSPATIVVGLLGGGTQNLGVVPPHTTAPFSLPGGNLDCGEFESQAFTVVATARGACQPAATESEVIKVICLEPPCIKLKLNPIDPTCEGTRITITGLVENCSDEPQTIEVNLVGDGSVNVGTVPAGGTAPFSLPAGVLDCGAEGFFVYTVTAKVSGDCGGVLDSKTLTVACRQPQLRVHKSAPDRVENGGTIHYSITVSNPSLTVDLEDVVVRDELCNYVRDPRNFGGTCPTGAPSVVNGTITWPAFDLPRNTSCTLTFDVTANVSPAVTAKLDAVSKDECDGSVHCENTVRVYGFCGDARVDASDKASTEIGCPRDNENCPRPARWWKDQCSLCDYGLGKFTREQLGQIARCVDNRSSFFNWTDGYERTKFCKILSLYYGTSVRWVAKKQFAALLANLCADYLNLTPRDGCSLRLDPNTPIHCDGLESDTIGELVGEVDRILAELEGRSLSYSWVVDKYRKIIYCLDGINSGRTIPIDDDCDCIEDHHDDARAGETGLELQDDSQIPGELEASDEIGTIELYRAVPNPFSGVTQFAYAVTADRDVPVDIGVYNVAGRKVRSLVNETRSPGQHVASWDGKDDTGVKVPQGVYFVRTIIGSEKQSVMRVIYAR